MKRYLNQYIKPTIPSFSHKQKEHAVLQRLSAGLPKAANETMEQFLKSNKALTEFEKEGYEMVSTRQLDEKLSPSSLRALGKQTLEYMAANRVSAFDLEAQDLSEEQLATVVNSLLLHNYKWEHKHLQESDKAFQPVSQVNLITQSISPLLQKQLHMASSALYNRSLINLRSNFGGTAFFQEQVEEIYSQFKESHCLELTTISGTDLLDEGLNLIYNVGRGSRQQPRLVMLKYKGDPSSESYTALVGKGVVFDAGGVNLKIQGSMADMHCDKGGACAVIATFREALQMGLKQNIVLGVGLVENMLGDDCYRQTDIIKSHKGLNVEIGNTDAEGRLVLADVMSYMQSNVKVHKMVELSTLTGACLVALGEKQAALFSNDESLAEQLTECGTATGESVWRLPITEEHNEAIKGTYGDICNTGKTRYGGSCTAAAFLQHFVEKDVQWAHLDIAGPAMVKVNGAAQGFGSQLLLEMLLRQE